MPASSRRPSSVSRIARGWPGRLMINAARLGVSRITATWRDRIAVGTKCRLTWRICSPKPGISFVPTASVASGVTSRRAGPVPPVVRIRSQPATSTSSISVREICAGSSGISRSTPCHGEVSVRPNHSRSAGMPSSW
ncbi:hypothetical protein AWV79_36030 [Cupriavidus sp. UYMMa02A]|nr:hypothetical protein AWV79_36030 [Cupriavidus sp. UYMMa02A]